MLGDQIRELREARCWSQAHLADAAALNIRTVQRIEAGEPCSYETMMSLAAALDVDVAILEQGNGRPAKAANNFQLAFAAACLAPLLLFVLLNLLRSALHLPAPYEAFAAVGEKILDFKTFNLISPAIFMGGGLAALAISTSSFVSIRRKMDGQTLSVTALELTANWRAVSLCLLSLSCLVTVLGYVALEQLLTMLR